MITFANGFSRLATGETINAQVKAAKAAGAKVERDNRTGTVIVMMGDVEAFRAIRKGGSGQPWIVRYNKGFYAE